MLFACHKASEERKNVWYLNNNCNTHITKVKEAFLDLDSTFFSEVKLDNGEYVEVQCKENIGVKTRQGRKVIHGTFYVPKLDEILLSIGKLLEHDL